MLGLPQKCSGYASELPLQRGQVPSLVGELRSQVLSGLDQKTLKKPNTGCCCLRETHPHWAYDSVRQGPAGTNRCEHLPRPRGAADLPRAGPGGTPDRHPRRTAPEPAECCPVCFLPRGAEGHSVTRVRQVLSLDSVLPDGAESGPGLWSLSPGARLSPRPPLHSPGRGARTELLWRGRPRDVFLGLLVPTQSGRASNPRRALSRGLGQAVRPGRKAAALPELGCTEAPTVGSGPGLRCTLAHCQGPAWASCSVHRGPGFPSPTPETASAPRPALEKRHRRHSSGPAAGLG